MANALEYALYYATGRTAGGVSGEHALVLGFPDESKIAETVAGDFIAFDQDIDVTDVDYVQLWVKGEVHGNFKLYILLDAVIDQWFTISEPFITRNVFMPVAINVSGITGVHNIMFKLLRTI